MSGSGARPSLASVIRRVPTATPYNSVVTVTEGTMDIKVLIILINCLAGAIANIPCRRRQSAKEVTQLHEAHNVFVRASCNLRSCSLSFCLLFGIPASLEHQYWLDS